MGDDHAGDAGGSGMNRRGFLRTTGVAATALTVGAGTAAGKGSGVSANNFTIESWDGTELKATLYTPAESGPRPSMLMTHGWGINRFSPLTLPKALTYAKNGYTVLTYDSRGFGGSEGTVMLDGPPEIKDAMWLLDWLADRDEVACEGEGDPKVGMDGVSYAGGIQLVTAAADDRIDAIVPRITWNDLQYSLAPHGVIKIGWLSLLLGAGAFGTTDLDPSSKLYGKLYEWYEQALKTNEIPQQMLAMNHNRSFAYVKDGFDREPFTDIDSQFDTPTFLLQGWEDALFKPVEAVRTYRTLQEYGVDSRIGFYRGGHDLQEITVPVDDREYMNDLALTWMDRHVRGKDVDIPQNIAYIQQSDHWRTAGEFPPSDTTPTKYCLGNATCHGENRIDRSSWWYDDEVRYTWEIDRPIEIYGTPQFCLEFDVHGPEARLFFNLYHDGDWINNIGEAYRIDGTGSQTAAFEFPTLQRYFAPGDELTLEIKASSPWYLDSRTSEGVTVKPGASTITLPQRPR
ncbi:MAG: CocE/NonD family hydrolase [Haloarculaceae archaeon]